VTRYPDIDIHNFSPLCFSFFLFGIQCAVFLKTDASKRKNYYVKEHYKLGGMNDENDIIAVKYVCYV